MFCAMIAADRDVPAQKFTEQRNFTAVVESRRAASGLLELALTQCSADTEVIGNVVEVSPVWHLGEKDFGWSTEDRSM